MHHVELLPDPDTDAAVRAEWRRLDDADLPSQQHHRSASNRPHVTVTMTAGWPADPAPLLDALAALPVGARLGAPVVFGRGPFVLARLVVVGAELLALHRAVAGVLGEPATELVAPDRWTPHVTLGRRMDGAQVAAALDLLGGGERPVSFGQARHWDSEARLDEALGS